MTKLTRRAVLGAGLAASTGAAQAAEQISDSAATRLTAYFRGCGRKLLRPAQGLLRHPSIAPSLPGRQYAAELWDWDTLWTARGLFRLAECTHDRRFGAEVALHAKGSLANFFDHQTASGRLPIVMRSGDADANRFPFAAPDRNQAKPVMAQLARLIVEKTGEVGWMAPLFDGLEAFHQSWLEHNLSRSGLLVWSNDVAIGNDDDPATFTRPPFSSANLLLNCLFYQDLSAAEFLAIRLGKATQIVNRIRERRQKLRDAILAACWDSRDEFFYSVDVQCTDRRAELIPNVAPGMATSWSSVPLRFQEFTGFLPLWCGIATPAQAAAMVARNYAADDRLRAAFGVRTLSKLEPMYTLAFSSNPSNWLGPVWIIANYFTWRGLVAYGFQALADELAAKTVRLLDNDLTKNGALNEYYHPDTGEALSHKGFIDWNMLVLEMV